MITALPRIAIAVRDFDAAKATFRDVFGMPVVDFSERTVPALGAHVAMCAPEGGSNIELMSPADPDKALSQALSKFLDSRGEGLYALMLEAPDPDLEAAALSERGLDVLPLMPGAGGRDVHPRSTHGVLIRVYPDNSAPTGQHPSEPPGFSGIMKVVVATADANLAAAVYGLGLGLDAGPVVHDEERGVLSASCRAPKGGVIELVSVVDPDKPFARDIERFLRTSAERRAARAEILPDGTVGASGSRRSAQLLKEHGAGMYALVLHAADPDRAVALVNARGLTTQGTAGREVVVYGTRFLIG